MAITRFPLETDQPVVEVTLPPGTHVLELVVEDSAGLRSAPDTVTITIENVLPVISGIEPAGARQGAANETVAISGLNLTNVQAVSFAGGGITVENFAEISPEQLQVTLSVDQMASPGPRSFTVETEAGRADSPPGVTFSVDEGLPVITAISPASGQPGAGQLSLTISGRYLQDVEAVAFLGGGIEVSGFTEIDPAALEVVVAIDSSAAVGPRRFRVTTDEGTADSPSEVVFTVAAPAPQLPVIQSISPSSGRVGTSLDVEIRGQNLSGAQSVTFIGIGLLITARVLTGGSDTRLPVNLQIRTGAPLGSFRFSVTTAAGTSTSPSSVTFRVLGVLPTLIPTEIVPTQILPTGIVPTGITPTSITPTGIVPTGITPTSITPTVIVPTGITPTSITPTGIVPTGIAPSLITPTSITPSLITPSAVIPTSIGGPPIGPVIFSARDFPGRSVQEVKGIGPATAERLKQKRITNLAHLASQEPGKLAEILDISEVRAMEFVTEARRLLTGDDA